MIQKVLCNKKQWRVIRVTVSSPLALLQWEHLFQPWGENWLDADISMRRRWHHERGRDTAWVSLFTSHLFSLRVHAQLAESQSHAAYMKPQNQQTERCFTCWYLGCQSSVDGFIFMKYSFFPNTGKWHIIISKVCIVWEQWHRLKTKGIWFENHTRDFISMSLHFTNSTLKQFITIHSP